MPRARAASANGTSLRMGEAGISSARCEISGMREKPTGIFLHIAPYIALIGAAIVSSLLFFRRKRVKDMDID